MIVWLWDAPGSRGCRGVSGDEEAAKRAAGVPLLAGHANRGRVEQAVVVLGTATLEENYRRTGTGWQARRSGARVLWRPLC
jgi:hypothetical protein